jgi:nucleotide-binding universal stress UspA family protein
VERVVVGVDGSPESRKALLWAAQDARRRGAELRVVHVHEPRLGYNPYEVSYASTSSPRNVERLALEERRWREHQRLAARQEAESVLDDLLEDLPAELRDVPIDRVVREGPRPARLLLDSARTADVLVVGSRGRGGFTGLLLGSVSAQCAQHASCPVVIVHAADRVIDLAAEDPGQEAAEG